MVAESPDFRSSSWPGFPATVTFPFASKLKVRSFASPPPFTFSLIVKVLFAGSTLTTSPTTVWLLDFVVAFWAAIDIVARPRTHAAARLRMNNLRILTYLLTRDLRNSGARGGGDPVLFLQAIQKERFGGSWTDCRGRASGRWVGDSLTIRGGGRTIWCMLRCRARLLDLPVL